MQNSLFDLVEKGAKGIFLGTRRTDPYSAKLKGFSPSDDDKGWPKFTRILPILDFSYKKIWDFFKEFSVPFNPLYNLGYTYLGDKSDSIPNPFLQNPDSTFKPAFLSSENYEPFSRKSIFQKLDINNRGNFLIKSESISCVVIRSMENVDPVQIVEQTGDIIEVAFSHLLQQNGNLSLKVTIEEIMDECERFMVVTDDFENFLEQEKRLAEIQRDIIIERASRGNKRIPVYIVYIDLVRKNCLIFE